MDYKENLTAEDIQKDIDAHVRDISKEIKEGFEFLKKYPQSVSIFGSARTKPEDPNYKMAHDLAMRIVRDLGYTVVTGGGPGIMEASNKGAHDCGGLPNGTCPGASLGLTIRLPHEQHTNGFVDDELKFDYFFTRKTMLTFAAEAYVFFPGGFGTFDELFSILTLIQTKKIPRVPIVLFGSQFWNPLQDFVANTMLEKFSAINADDMDLYSITDDIDEAIHIIREAPKATWWTNRGNAELDRA